MLITLCYVYLWLRFRSRYAVLIRHCVGRFHRTSSFTFCSHNQERGEKIHSGRQGPGEEKLCLRVGNKAFFIDNRQLFEDLNKWSLLLSPRSDSHLGVRRIAFITESASLPSETLSAASHSPKKVRKLSEYCLPLALYHGDSSRLLAEASVDNFSELGIAFMEDRLQMDNGSLPQKITSVHLRESLANKSEALQEDGLVETTSTKEPNVSSSEKNPKEDMGAAESAEMICSQKSDGNSDASGGTDPEQKDEAVGEHLHLHLSSCHECLELESCTIESVKFASAENIPELPDDSFSFEDNSDCLGEASALNRSGKPPNVLIYGGTSSQDRLQQVKDVLLQCFDSCRYVVYPLREEQALKDPWMDNCLLLVVVAEEPIPSQVQNQFISYMENGGKILGLSSSFTFGNLGLQTRPQLKDCVQAFVFDGPNGNLINFNGLASGYVYEMPRDDQVDGWIYIDGDNRDLIMVHQTYGDCGGEAVLCQVRLEIAPQCQTDYNKETFDSLKLGNPQRHEVLTEVLTSLGLNCGSSSVPSLTPVYLLTARQEDYPDVLQWIQSRSKNGLIKSSKMSLKICDCPQHDMDISPSLGALITGEESFTSEDFNMNRYRENLQTEKLGKAVLFSEVTTSTFSVLDGLMFHEPKEMGLIAIATQQTQGKGRGGNDWLSPKGGALMTLLVTIPVSSPLGQRIAFVQHLMSLAVVEAVRTLPGYEDIELNLKWPNDIYYSNLMKVGGVLVNSTLMGNMFHILIGCGFNVTNSNPTICINDLVYEHNKRYETNIDPLRVDTLIARSVTALERLIDIFQKKGSNGILPSYYKYWVHSGQKIRLGGEDGPLVEIVGLDDSGFLQVLQDGKIIVTVHPDGNSFDMIRNLIIPKRS
ncbi:biotin--protein ligase [Bufo bufo]|uniref:biotin--protein ligase n=1 Tax=Bufo bufo TaxID=8384 RepID=UPI001ABEAA95|nr:biotin--protein ligase [Bufo bufo]XP_040279041.1 biotin--protein ligase [Bufo bufo]XP_040279042.1 biotin--protein ligase [Bufo bufo]XP_040279043.1 biotin--protein ligase [Bufo bufo]